MTIAAAAAAMVVWSAGLASAATGWVVQTTVNPTGALSSVLSGVSCVSADRCTATGYAITTSGPAVMVAEHWNGSTWAIQATPAPTGSTSPELGGVSCTSAANCTATGDYYSHSAARWVTLAEHWNGHKWAAQTPPNPAGGGLTDLTDVSCASATSCIATGYYMNISGQWVTLAEQWNGSTWTIQVTPDPTGSTSAYLDLVSCTSATSCTAAGYSTDSSGQSAPLAEYWNGNTWAIQATPTPTGSTGAHLSAVSCTSATSCTAAGYSTDSSGQSAPLAEHWDGSTWAIQATPTPTGSTGAHLFGVSCASAASCTAAGDYNDSSGQGAPLAEHWNGHKWAIQATPIPAGTTSGDLLLGVSCASTATCTAVGYYESTSGQVTLAEHK